MSDYIMAKIFFGFGNKKKNPFEQMTEEELKRIMRLFEEVKKDLSRKLKKNKSDDGLVSYVIMLEGDDRISFNGVCHDGNEFTVVLETK